jgi:hypothetical protein
MLPNVGSGGADIVQRVASTEITLVTGDRLEVAGSPDEVESSISGAARGSILQLAWLSDAASGRRVGVNPAHVVAIRAAPPPEGS